MRYFFEDKLTYPYLFTLQMRLLLSKLHHLSQLHRFNFTKWWLLATKLNLPFERESLIRTIVFNNKPIRIEAGALGIEQEIRSKAGYRVTYRLTGWTPVDEAGRQAFEAVQRFANSQTVYFAADFDHDRSFHVNDWPEANEQIETWIRAGGY